MSLIGLVVGLLVGDLPWVFLHESKHYVSGRNLDLIITTTTLGALAGLALGTFAGRTCGARWDQEPSPEESRVFDDASV